MERKQIAALLTTTVNFSRRGYTATAFFRGQEVGSSAGFKYKDRAVQDALEVGTEVVVRALHEQELETLQTAIANLLTHEALQQHTLAAHTYMQQHASNPQKLKALKARCEQVIAAMVSPSTAQAA